MSLAVELKGVHKEYPGGEAPLVVLDAVDFRLGEGEAAAIVGTSGCGKSTLLNIVGTLDNASSGEVKLFGRDVSGMNEKALADLRARNIGFVFQMHHLLPQCSVLENVLVPTLALGSVTNAEETEERARGLIERVGLGERLHHRPAQLSGGERQRVAVVRALINEPRLLLADEPTGALDGSTADDLAKLLLDLNRERKVAIILVTHDRDLAQRVGNVHALRQGRLMPAGGRPTGSEPTGAPA